MKHTLSVLVENKPGVLTRVAGLFARRGFNIDSLAVGETEDPGASRMTIVARGDDQILEQIRKQLSKLVDVIKVTEYRSEDGFVERDLMLLKVAAPPPKRHEILAAVGVFRGKVVDLSAGEAVIEISGTEDKIEAFVNLMRPYGIKELARTGRIAMLRGAKRK